MTKAKYTNGSTSQLIKTGKGTLYGIVINSHTTGTIKLWDNTSAAGTVILNTYTPTNNSEPIVFPMGISFYTGLFITITGTVDYTILDNVD